MTFGGLKEAREGDEISDMGQDVVIVKGRLPPLERCWLVIGPWSIRPLDGFLRAAVRLWYKLEAERQLQVTVNLQNDAAPGPKYYDSDSYPREYLKVLRD